MAYDEHGLPTNTYQMGSSPVDQCGKRVYPVNQALVPQQEGRKYDQGKCRLDLLCPGFVWEVAEVLTHGANKYGAHNWQMVEAERYEAALLRHFIAWQCGEETDPETGLHHLTHLACSAMFLWYKHGNDPKTIPSRRCQCTHCTRIETK